MSHWIGWSLLAVFAAHLVAFAWLWWRRRQGYYIALVVTFTLLTASVGMRLSGGGPLLAGRPIDIWLRLAAWAAAGVSVSWTLARLIKRRRQADRQNCS